MQEQEQTAVVVTAETSRSPRRGGTLLECLRTREVTGASAQLLQAATRRLLLSVSQDPALAMYLHIVTLREGVNEWASFVQWARDLFMWTGLGTGVIELDFNSSVGHIGNPNRTDGVRGFDVYALIRETRAIHAFDLDIGTETFSHHGTIQVPPVAGSLLMRQTLKVRFHSYIELYFGFAMSTDMLSSQPGIFLDQVYLNNNLIIRGRSYSMRPTVRDDSDMMCKLLEAALPYRDDRLGYRTQHVRFLQRRIYTEMGARAPSAKLLRAIYEVACPEQSNGWIHSEMLWRTDSEAAMALLRMKVETLAREMRAWFLM